MSFRSFKYRPGRRKAPAQVGDLLTLRRPAIPLSQADKVSATSMIAPHKADRFSGFPVGQVDDRPLAPETKGTRRDLRRFVGRNALELAE